MALTIPSATTLGASQRSLAVRRWAVRLALAILLAISALLAFGALSAAAPMSHTTSHITTASAGPMSGCDASIWEC